MAAPRTAVPHSSSHRRIGSAGPRRRRNGRLVLLLRADAVHILDRDDEDLPVSDFARAGGVEDRADGDLDERVRHADLEAHLLVQLHLHRGAAVGLHRVGLAAVAEYARDGEALHFRAVQTLEDVVQLVRSDDRDDELHATPPAVATLAGRATGAGSAFSRTSSAPSPLLYASSPCCVISMPRPCALASAASALTMAMALRSTKLAMAQ